MPTLGLLHVKTVEALNESEEMVKNAAVRALSLAGYESVVTDTVEHGPQDLKTSLLALCARCDLVFTVGGVGFAPDDVVPEITHEVIDRLAPGIAELIRGEMHKHSEVSHLNRGTAGMRGRTIIINLPGTPETVKQAIETLSLLLRPMLAAVQGPASISAPV